MPPIAPHILHRLMLAKAFVRDAERASRTSRNDLVLSQVVVHLHDAVDNLLGAIATHHALHLTVRDGMVDAYIKIDSAGHSLGNRPELDQLNVMRVAIKHQGVPQNAAAVIALLPVVREFCNRVSQNAFGVTLDAVTLSMLIESSTVRQQLDDILHLIEANDYKSALEQLAILRFKTQQSMWLEVTSWWNRDKNNQPLRDQAWVFPDDRIDHKKLECLELGIDPDELTRFEWLTPKVGYDNLEDKNLIFKKQELFWHEKNWTYENAMFCFNFLVSYLAAKQKSPDASTVVRQHEKRNRVRVLRSSALMDHKGNVLKNLSPDEEVVCSIGDFVDGDWQNHGDSFARVTLHEADGTVVQGFLRKDDIAVGPNFDEVYR